MSQRSVSDDAALDCPVAWPRPHEGHGLGGPLVRDERLKAWVVSSYADVDRVLRDAESFSSQLVVGPERAAAFGPLVERVAQDSRAAVAMTFFQIPMISSDGDRHRRERSFVAKAFTPKRVRAYEPVIRQLCEELTEGMLGRSAVPFVEEFAVPLPVQVIAHGLGMPREDFRDFKRWSDGFQGLIGASEPDDEALEEFLVAAVEFTAYISPLIERRRAEPADDIISVLADASQDGERLDTQEILAMCAALLLAGNETSTAALAGILLYLTRRPELQEQVRRDPALVPPLVEEGLRLTSPAQALFRTATVDTEVAGVPVAAGEHLCLRLAAGNRDDLQFDAPLRPRLDRDDKRHLAFGRGAHVCVGGPLARTEIRIAFETLLERTSELTLSARPDAVVPTGNIMTAGVGELYVDVRG